MKRIVNLQNIYFDLDKLTIVHEVKQRDEYFSFFLQFANTSLLLKFDEKIEAEEKRAALVREWVGSYYQSTPLPGGVTRVNKISNEIKYL